MPLEERIVAWSKERPAWQREVMRRTATGDFLSDEDYDRLVDDIVAPDLGSEVAFGLEHLPKAADDDPSVRLISIAKTKHVNALASGQPLTFKPNGLTIVYGDNGERQVRLRTTAEADHAGAAPRRGSLRCLPRHGDGETHGEPFGSYR